MKMIKLIIFLLCFNFAFLSYFAQSQLIFKHLTTADGLPDDGIEWVIQDHLGFIWIASREGMVKYDGYEFQQYKVGHENTIGLDQDRIRVVFEDSRGDIWGGAEGYLNRYIRIKDTLITYKSDDNDPNALKGHGVYSIIEDSGGRIWLGNYRGWINYIERSELEKMDYNISFNHLREEEYEETYIVFSLFEDSDHNIWACTRNGLLKIKDNDIEVIQVKPGKKYDRNNTFFSIIEDEKNKFWVGTYGNGLAYYNDLEKSFDFYTYRKSNFRRYASSNILSLLIDKKGFLWGGTQGAGILKFDRRNKTFEHFYNNQIVPTSLLKGYFHNLFEDNSGTIWIPAFQTGISRIDPSLNQTEQFYYGINNKINLGSEIILCMFESSEGKIWVGTENGLKLYDESNDNFKKIVPVKQGSCDNQIRVLEITEDINGNLWIQGFWNRNIWEYNPQNNRIRCYGVSNDGFGLSHPYVNGIKADDEGYVWVSTYGGGLYRIDINTKEFKRYYIAGRENKKDDPEEIKTMALDSSGNIWLTSYDRTLSKLNKESESFTRKSFSDFEGGFDATGMLIDSKNRLWLATRQAGIILYNLGSGGYRKFTTNDGLPTNDRITHFFEDKAGDIYCICDNKLIRFNAEGDYDKYYEFDTGSQYFISAGYVKKNNEIYLSTNEQLLRFKPNSIIPNQTPPKMVFTKLTIFDKSENNEIINPTDTPINISRTVELEHFQNDITFEFAALHYTNPPENQYKYILDNYDKKWHPAGHIRTAKYTNLSHGEYLFKVIGSNSDGIWTDIPATLKIVIRPPWWVTWWAYMIYSFIFLSILITTWMLQLRRIRIRNELKMKEFEAEKLKEVDQMKSNFFANISHEFRTPLTLIKGPVERFLYEEKKEEKREIFKMILRNTKKLLNLINELLDLSKLEAGKMKLCVGEFDIVSFTKGIVMSFKSLAESKEISLSVKSSDNLIKLYFDKEKMQRIISNLISNALKFTPERGSIKVELKKQIRGNKIIIDVIDSGIGIPEKELPKLFDRFYQVIRDGSEGTTGTGIGLALTKELVLMHKGTIDVMSRVDQGTVFTISLPLGRDHFSDEDIILTDESEFDADKVELYDIDDNYKEDKNIPRILIVEDNEDVLKFIHDNLKGKYNTVCAENGEQGFEKAKEKIPDLIVSDIMMPVMDGNRMCELIKKDEKTSHIPVILLTAKAAEEDKLKGLETGADDYITKPFDPLELLIRIKNLIMQRRKLREKYLKEAEIHPSEVAVNSTDKIFIDKAIKFIEYKMSDPSLSVKELADNLAMSRSQLYRKFDALLGERPNDFIRKYRLKRAADLFKKNFGNITQVAYEVGFNDPSYFTKCFRELFKISPFEFEKRLNKEKELNKEKSN